MDSGGEMPEWIMWDQAAHTLTIDPNMTAPGDEAIYKVNVKRFEHRFPTDFFQVDTIVIDLGICTILEVTHEVVPTVFPTQRTSVVDPDHFY